MAENSKFEVINPPNLLQVKVGNKLADQEHELLKGADKALASLQKEFSDWLDQDIKALIQARDQFYNNPPSDENLQSLICSAHDLKGLGATYEYPLVTHFAANLQGYLEPFGEAGNLDKLPSKLIVDAFTNAIRAVHADDIKDENNKLAQTLLKELRELMLATKTSAT